MPLHITNYPPREEGEGATFLLESNPKPLHLAIAWAPRSSLPWDWQPQVTSGLFIINDSWGYLCATESVEELKQILVDESIRPYSTRERLTGYDFQSLRAYTHGPRTSRRPGEPRKRTSSTRKPAPDLSDLTGGMS